MTKMRTLLTENYMDILDTPVSLPFNLNDLRIIVGCFKAVAYQATLDDEPYLDADAIALMKRLAAQYEDELRLASG
jgi:hypothetical protein